MWKIDIKLISNIYVIDRSCLILYKYSTAQQQQQNKTKRAMSFLPISNNFIQFYVVL